MSTCINCGQAKTQVVAKTSGREYWVCTIECRRNTHRAWQERNRHKVNASNTRYREKNRDRCREMTAAWTSKNITYVRDYLKEYARRKRREDANFKLASRLRTRVRSAIRNNQRAGSAVRDLGCTIPELRAYFETKFASGMSWDNHGDWHIDHIIPLSSFDLTNREQFLRACHYTNLQPLWAVDNLIKSNKVG